MKKTMIGPPHILIMDDDPIIRAELGEFLSNEGFEVTSCSTATEAKSFLNDQPVDLVISDIFVQKDGGFVPDGGISLLGWLRTHLKIPSIAITGVPDTSGIGYLKHMKAMGADRCIEKPVNRDILLREIQKLLSIPGGIETD